jgi:bile acid-coenzyme A ligase
MTETPFGVLVAQLARAGPGFPAVTCDEVTISRADFETRTNRLARVYRALGVTPDSLVTIGLPNGIGFFEAAVAAWKLGATPQPISSRLPPAERRAIIDLADPSLVVGVDRAEAPGRATLPAGFEPDPSLPADELPPAVATSFKAPTSGGSTGRPKLIVATQRAVWEALATTRPCCGWPRTACTSSPGPSITTARSRAPPSRCSRATTSW